MEVLVTVTVEDVFRDEPAKIAITAYLTYVAIDENRKPKQVPSLELVNEEDRRLYEEGQQRYLAYKQRKNKASNLKWLTLNFLILPKYVELGRYGI